jgi:hypothetical protein
MPKKLLSSKTTPGTIEVNIPSVINK